MILFTFFSSKIVNIYVFLYTPFEQLGRTPLHLAVSIGQYNISEVLVNHLKAQVSVSDNKGKHPLYFASYYGFVDIARLLIKEISKKGKDDIDKLLRGSDSGWPAIVVAANNDANFEIVLEILDAATNFNSTLEKLKSAQREVFFPCTFPQIF